MRLALLGREPGCSAGGELQARRHRVLADLFLRAQGVRKAERQDLPQLGPQQHPKARALGPAGKNSEKGHSPLCLRPDPGWAGTKGLSVLGWGDGRGRTGVLRGRAVETEPRGVGMGCPGEASPALHTGLFPRGSQPPQKGFWLWYPAPPARFSPTGR